MKASLAKFLKSTADAFWLVPASMVVAGAVLAETLVQIDRSGVIAKWVEAGWLYGGGESGARTLLGAVASSTIGVAGTVFSITIAALAFAASQMGPRLLNNFTRDRGNQATLGLFLGTFAFALAALRSVRGVDESVFVPHLAVTAAIVLAIACVAMLVYFVHHMAGRINVDTVLDLVHEDFRASMKRLTVEREPPDSPPMTWESQQHVVAVRHGYLQQLDEQSLADWAAEHDLQIRLLVRPGNFIFPGARIAECSARHESLDEAVAQAMAVGKHAVDSADLEFGVRQLVDVAVRALSPGINDPQTAIGVLDRLGSSLCELAARYLPNGKTFHDGSLRVTRPCVDYVGLCDAMFHGIRQNARGSAIVLIHMLDVLAKVSEVERDPGRRIVLQRHVQLVLDETRRAAFDREALAAVRKRERAFYTASGQNGRYAC